MLSSYPLGEPGTVWCVEATGDLEILGENVHSFSSSCSLTSWVGIYFVVGSSGVLLTLGLILL